MRRLASLFTIALSLVACGSPAPVREAVAPLDIAPLDAGAAAKAILPSPRAPALDLATFIASPEVQAVTSAHAAAFLNVAEARTLRVAPKLREIVQTKTKMELFDDVDWVLWVGPSIQHDEDGAVLVGVRPGVDVQWSIERLMRGARNGASHLDELDVDGVRGWRLPDRKVVLRVRDDRVVVVREPQAAAAVASFRKPLSGAPAPGVIAGMYGMGEGARFAGLVPGNDRFEDVRVSLETRRDGAAFVAVGRCSDAKEASAIADGIKALITQLNSGGLRASMHGLLDDASTTTSGSSVELHVPISDEQLDFLVQALVAMP